MPGIEIWLGIGYNFCMNTTNTETNGSTLDLLGQAREIRGKIDEALKKEVQEVGTQSILGLLLIIPNFIRLNLDNVRNYLTSRSPIKNSTLAAAILLYAENGRATEEIVETLQPLGFGQTAIKDAIRCLHLVNWIDIKPYEESESTVTLTEKAKDILTERGIWVGIFEPKTPPGFSETT